MKRRSGLSLRWRSKTVLFVASILFTVRADATIRYFHWDKPHHGNRGNVTAIDLSTGKILWETLAGKSVNFVQDTSVGIAVGNDEGEIVLLEKSTGKAIWRCVLRKSGEREIKFFLGESDEGFFVSSGDSYFWLVSRDGKVLIRCEDGCMIPAR